MTGRWNNVARALDVDPGQPSRFDPFQIQRPGGGVAAVATA
ncbi:MAG TPA: hypothetical protein VH988_29355 [Thermoanaerobaculia bacterium]|nr:hypothetical protein [Thermoanaerobaculia bacterium]